MADTKTAKTKSVTDRREQGLAWAIHVITQAPLQVDTAFREVMIDTGGGQVGRNAPSLRA
jgi:hypothetical protein